MGAHLSAHTNETHVGDDPLVVRTHLTDFVFSDNVDYFPHFYSPYYWGPLMAGFVISGIALNIMAPLWMMLSKRTEEKLPPIEEPELPIILWPLDEEYKQEQLALQRKPQTMTQLEGSNSADANETKR
uniref:PDR_CDR domain-containing protein n=1 Tax=Panagrellus redivivus TaxID=6233 RepID=A0A7E4VB48_PANRE